MFWEQFYKLCVLKNIAPNTVCKELALSNATATHWKNGKLPGSDTLTKIADYFNCPTDYLLGRGIFQNWDKIMENKLLIFSYLHYQFGKEFTDQIVKLTEIDLMRWFDAFIKEVRIIDDDIEIEFRINT